VCSSDLIGAVPMRRSEDNTHGVYSLTVRTPVECVLMDLLIHESLPHFGRAKHAVYGHLEDRPITGVSKEASRPATIQEPEWAAELGQPAVMQTHRFPRLSPMVEECLSLGGFGGLSEYRGYRAEIDYPSFPCDTKFLVELGDGGKSPES